MTYPTFAAWLKATHPRLQRRQPTAQIHSGSNRSIVDCICGMEITYASKWRVPKRVERFREQHDRDCWPAGVPREGQ